LAGISKAKVLEKEEFFGDVAVVTDSASDIMSDVARELKISIVPIYIHHGGKEFRDGVDIKPDDIYRLQREEKALFFTSSPSPNDFLKIYEKLLKEYRRVISIHISSNLSAVIKSAIIARDLLNSEDRIEVFDGFSGTMGTGFMVLAAAKAVQKKYSYEKIMGILNFLRDNTKLYGTLDTLKYLRRSGRVPAIANFVSRLLAIKPVLGITDGVVGMIGISVSRYGSLWSITRKAVRDFKDERWVAVSVIHTLGLEESRRLMKNLQQNLNVVYSVVNKCTPAVGAHTGPGLIGIIISRLNRETAGLFIKN
jgi:DegV family protein with EDD domain